jgi:hypothetical protein
VEYVEDELVMESVAGYLVEVEDKVGWERTEG